jgi:predicted MFS family arabinose efflux permease
MAVRLDPYRQVLARPGVRALMVTTLLTRIPVTATGLVLTLHVVLGADRGGLGRSYTDAGLVAAATALGSGLGAPWIGRLIDRTSLIPVVAVTSIAQAAFWASVPSLPYAGLVPGAFLGGLFTLPVFVVSRQSLAVRLNDHDRGIGFVLDSMSIELSYSIGPALGALVITQFGSDAALYGLAIALTASGIALSVLNPPVHSPPAAVEQPADGPDAVEVARPANVSARSWLNRPVIALLVITVGATATLAGTDVAITAMMRSFGEVSLLGIVIAVWCLGSLAGGFVYGTMRRRVDPIVLLLALAALTLPVAFAPSWWTLALLLIPSTIFCAPLISSTADQLIGLTPPSERGAVMGSHASALTFGALMGAPLAGVSIDNLSPAYGFVAVGLAGLVLAAIAVQIRHRRRPLERSSEPAGTSDGLA